MVCVQHTQDKVRIVILVRMTIFGFLHLLDSSNLTRLLCALVVVGASGVWEMYQTINEAYPIDTIPNSVVGYLVLLQQQLVESTYHLAQLIYSEASETVCNLEEERS